VDSQETQAPPVTSTEGATPAGAPAVVPTTHPPALYFFFWGEFAERASYYGMRGILFMYLTAALHFSDADATSIVSWFKMACYFLPLVGGFLADRYFGKYWTIVGFSVPYVLGHFILGIENNVAMFIALALLAGGSGVTKPNISTLLGQTYDQQRPGQERLRSAAFMWFYFSINVGAFLSTLITPYVRDRASYQLAFLFPALLMVGALIAFAAGKPYYAVETRQPPRPKSPEERRQQWETLVRLFGVFGLITFFWVAYEQNDNLWVSFARDYTERYVPFLDYTIPPDQIQTLNPLFVIILIPLFNWLFKRIDPQVRLFTPTRKILLGFILTGAAAGIISASGFAATATGAKVSAGWVALAYVVLTVGEVLLYATALEMAYVVAPKNMKSFVTACFLVTNTLGNFINSGLGRLYGGSLTVPSEQRGLLPPGQFFALSALFPLAAAVAFYFVGKQFDRQMRSADPAAA
jgi:dipeptide/tripeptide permease